MKIKEIPPRSVAAQSNDIGCNSDTTVREYTALVAFYANGPVYLYRTYMSDLVEGDSVIVEARGDWKLATFRRYTVGRMVVVDGNGGKRTAPELLKDIIARVDPVTVNAKGW